MEKKQKTTAKTADETMLKNVNALVDKKLDSMANRILTSVDVVIKNQRSDVDVNIDAAVSATKEAIIAKMDARMKDLEKAIGKVQKYSIGYRIAKLFRKV